MNGKFFWVAIVPVIVAFIVLGVFIKKLFEQEKKFDNYSSITSTSNVNDLYIKGKVLANNFGCSEDAACYISVKKEGDGIVNVAYAIDKQDCNNKASVQGYAIEEGQEVEIYGKNHSKDLMSTCESQAYYINKVK